MAKKTTAHRPSQKHMQYVTTRDGRRVKNTAYVGQKHGSPPRTVSARPEMRSHPRSILTGNGRVDSENILKRTKELLGHHGYREVDYERIADRAYDRVIDDDLEGYIVDDFDNDIFDAHKDYMRD